MKRQFTKSVHRITARNARSSVGDHAFAHKILADEMIDESLGEPEDCRFTNLPGPMMANWKARNKLVSFADACHSSSPWSLHMLFI